ncbi:MAG: hypothetical protein ABFD82_04150 [Syntrophaceae bacterium]
MSVQMSASSNADQVLFGFSPPTIQAKTLLDAITLIQEYSIAEGKSPLPETFLTLKGQALLFSIGFFASMDSVIYSFFLVPIGIFIFLYPGEKPLAAKLFAIMLMVVMPLATSLLLSSLAKYPKWPKGLTVFAISRLLTGVFTGGLVISMIAFAAFYFFLTKLMLYYYPLLQTQHGSRLPVLPEYVTFIPLPSAWLILALHILLPLIPCMIIAFKRWHIRKNADG